MSTYKSADPNQTQSAGVSELLSGGQLVGPGNPEPEIDVSLDNVDAIWLASGPRTTTQTSADLPNVACRGIKVTLDVTVPGTGSVTLSINYKDKASGKYITLLSGAAVITAVTNVYTVYPGAAVVANVSANDVLPRTFQLKVLANNTNSCTYSVGYSLIR